MQNYCVLITFDLLKNKIISLLLHLIFNGFFFPGIFEFPLFGTPETCDQEFFFAIEFVFLVIFIRFSEMLSRTKWIVPSVVSIS